jgi:hypothetical protein
MPPEPGKSRVFRRFIVFWGSSTYIGCHVVLRPVRRSASVETTRERAPNQPENFFKLIVRLFTSGMRMSRIAALNALKEIQ